MGGSAITNPFTLTYKQLVKDEEVRWSSRKSKTCLVVCLIEYQNNNNSVKWPRSSGIAAGVQFFARTDASTTSRCVFTRRPCAAGTSIVSNLTRTSRTWALRRRVVLAPCRLIPNTQLFVPLGFLTVSSFKQKSFTTRSFNFLILQLAFLTNECHLFK